jgi:hypothetical protein
MSDILPQIVPEEPEPAHEELPPETTAVPPAIQPTLADTRLPPAKPPTKPSHRTWWIVGIVAAAILVCSVVCGILFGSAIFKSIVERPNVEKVIDQFMRAMAEKDADRAYALFSSRSKRKTPLADIEKLTEGNNYKLFEGYRSVELTNLNLQAAISTNPDSPQGTVGNANGTISYDGNFTGAFRATLEKEGENWRIFGINVTAPPDKFGP